MKKKVKILTDDEFEDAQHDPNCFLEQCQRCGKHYSQTLENWATIFCPKCVPKQASGYAMCPQLDPKITPVTKEFLNSDGASFLYGWNTGIIYGEKDWWEFNGKKEIRKAPPVMFQCKGKNLSLAAICDKFGIYVHVEKENNYQIWSSVQKVRTQKEAIRNLYMFYSDKCPDWFLKHYDFDLEFESRKDLMYDCERILGKKG